MSKDTGGSAFPEVFTDSRNGVSDTYSAGGMTLRDYFAAKAMQAMIAKMPMYDVEVDDEVEGLERYDDVLIELCTGAWDYADVMLLTRGE